MAHESVVWAAPVPARRARGVAVALLLLVTAGCTPNGDSPDSSPVPTVQEGSSPDQSAPDDTSASDPEAGSLPNPGEVEPGTHTLTALEPSPTVELGDGWWAGWDHGDNISMPEGVVALEHRLPEGFVRLAFWDPTDLEIGGSIQPDVGAFVRELPTVSGLTEQTIAVGGVDATRFDFAWTGGFEGAINIPRAGFVFADDEPQHWIVLDTADGQLLVNWTVENATGADLEAEAETLIGPVLDSLSF